MADYKFSCPICGQNIQCDEQWSGQQIACPSCAGSLAIPQLGAAAAVPLGAPPSKRASKPFKQIAAWSMGGAAFIVALFFGFKAADKWQAGFNERSKETAANSGGGELTHIARLNQVLDATDPARMEKAQMESRAAIERERAKMEAELRPKADPTLALPVSAPAWTLDATTAIPKGRVNGGSGGKNFHVENVRLDRGASLAVLTFQEGAGTAADHEVLIYLPAAAAENLAGRRWSVTQQSTSRESMQIVRKWTVNPKYAPVQKAFPKGYLLKLELDQPTRDWQPGRIYLALPDTNKTVLAGEFSIAIPRQPVPQMFQE